MRRVLFTFAVLAAAACFQPWTVSGPYLCGQGCPDNMLCDDGVCCFADKAPICRALVLDGGTCASGATPQRYYEDFDQDGFGNRSSSKLYCASPLSDHFVDDDTDCNDREPTVNPNAQEGCDGLDNDCDGTVDEGQPQRTFFRDQDKDGYGDPASSVTQCAATADYSDNNSDCGPNQPFRHPNAPELCNGLDDDCDAVTDESPTDVGLSCSDGGFGLCGPGTTVCVAGQVVCASTTGPSPDVCDGQDNNCNGQVDEQPECGGPASLIGPGTLTGALNLQQAVPFGTLTAQCVRNLAGATGETWSAPSWTGSSSNHHLWYAEAPAGRTWDLSKPGLVLGVHFNWSMLGGQPTYAWDYANQPVVYLCGLTDTSFNRYVPSPSLLDAGTQSGNVNANMPIAGGNGWTVGFGSALDLKKVKRVEVLMKPRFTTGGLNPTFTVVWRADAGFL